MSLRRTTSEFISASKKIHGEKYDYSNVEYTTRFTKVKLCCYKHGEFFQQPCHHLKGHGCPKCMGEGIGNQFRENLNVFISKAIKIHGDLYDYSRSVYVGSKHKIELICKKHNTSFWQQAGSHLRGAGCPHCKWDLLTSEGIMVDKGSLRLKEWLESRGYLFHFQYFVPTLHVSIDFYDPTSNVVIEYDSRYHHSKTQQRKDRLREEKIIAYLQPVEFWRIDGKTKTAKNILV